jgi:hypothetical protein
MRKLAFLLLLQISLSTLSIGQTLVSTQLKGTKTKAQITASFNLPLIKFGAKFYKINYKSTDAKGQLDTLSGLMVIPDVSGYAFPVAYYQHGTSDCKTCVPSRYTGVSGNEGEVGLIGAGLGFINILPDYVGMGDGRGFQTYVHAATTVTASLDMLNAVNEWLGSNEIKTNGQLFITGYSQGGYASMALHKAIEEKHPELTVTAAAHLSGPYSVSGVMRNLVLDDKEYGYPAYLPNTLMGLNEVNNELYTSLNDVFKPEYTTEIAKYYNGTLSLTNLNVKLIALLKANNGGKAISGQMLIDSVKQVIKTDLNHPVNLALRQNDLYRWAPKAPTKIYYCTADDQVSYLNSITAKDTMTSLGAVDLEVRDVLPTANHGTCFAPALTNTILFFLSKQQLLPTSVSEVEEDSEIIIYPNPTTDLIAIYNVTPRTRVEIYDALGRSVHQGVSQGSIYTTDISHLMIGQYLVKAIINGKTVTRPIQKI